MKKYFKHTKKLMLLVLTVVMLVATSMVVLAAETKKAPDPKNLTILTVGIQNTNKDGSLKFDANGNKSIKTQSPVLYTNGSEFEVTLPGTNDNEDIIDLPNSITLDVSARIKIDKNEDGKINSKDKGEGSHINGEYTVKSSNESVATVKKSADGETITIYAGDMTGTANIKLTEKNPVNPKKPKSVTVKVTVKALVDEITFDSNVVSDNTVNVGVKGTATLGTATNADASKKTVKYVVSKEDAAYISVNSKGVITAKKNTAALEGGYAEVTVVAQDQNYNYTVTDKKGKVSTKKAVWGENEVIRVYVNDPEVKSVKVLNVDFAVDKKGNSLEANYKNGKSAQSYKTIDLKTNASSDMHTFKLQVSAYSDVKWGGVQKENAVTYTTSNAKIATVDKNGVITAHANGSAKITIVPVDGVKLAGKEAVTINVKVTTSVEQIIPAVTETTAYSGSTYTVKANVNANVSDKKEKTLEYAIVSATPAKELGEGESYGKVGKVDYDNSDVTKDFKAYVEALSGAKNVAAGKIKSNFEGTVVVKVFLKDDALAAAHPELEKEVTITFVDPISSVKATVPVYQDNDKTPVKQASSTTLYVDRNAEGTVDGYVNDSCEITTVVAKKFAKEVHNLANGKVDLSKVTVATSDANVATVALNEEGDAFVVQAVGKGKATITISATDGSKKSAKVTINVQQKVNDITVTNAVDGDIYFVLSAKKKATDTTYPATTAKFAATANADANKKGLVYSFESALGADLFGGSTTAVKFSGQTLTLDKVATTALAEGFEDYADANGRILVGTLTVTAKDGVAYKKVAGDEVKHTPYATTVNVYALDEAKYFENEAAFQKVITDALGTTGGITLYKGQKLAVGAKVVIPAEITSRTLTWSTSNKSFVAVDKNGQLTGSKVTNIDEKYTITVKTGSGKYELNEKGKEVEIMYTCEIPVRVIASQADFAKELDTQITALLKENNYTWLGVKPAYNAKKANLTLAITDITVGKEDADAALREQLTNVFRVFKDAAEVATSGTSTKYRSVTITDPYSKSTWSIERVGADVKVYGTNVEEAIYSFTDVDAAIADLSACITGDMDDLVEWANKNLTVSLVAENTARNYETYTYAKEYTVSVTAKDADIENYLDAKVAKAAAAFEAANEAINPETEEPYKNETGLGAVTYDPAKNATTVEIYNGKATIARAYELAKDKAVAALEDIFTNAKEASLEVVVGAASYDMSYVRGGNSDVDNLVEELYAKVTEKLNEGATINNLDGVTVYATVKFDFSGKEYVKNYEVAIKRTAESIDAEIDAKIGAFMETVEETTYGKVEYVADSNYAKVTVSDFEAVMKDALSLVNDVEGFVDTLKSDAFVTKVKLISDNNVKEFEYLDDKGAKITATDILTVIKPEWYEEGAGSILDRKLAELVGTRAIVEVYYSGTQLVYYTIDFTMDITLPEAEIESAMAEQVAINNALEITEDSIVLDALFDAEANTAAVALNKAKANTTIISLNDTGLYAMFESVLTEAQKYYGATVTVTGNGKTTEVDLTGEVNKELVIKTLSALKVTKVSNLTSKPFEIVVKFQDNQTLKYVVTFKAENVAGISRSPIMLDKMSFSQKYEANKVICKEVYYTGRVGEMILTVTGKDAYVIYNGVTYEAVDGVVTVQIEKQDGFFAPMPVFAIGNNGAKAATYKVALTYPVGHQMNPETIKDLSDFASYLDNAIEAGNTAGYFYTYTAVADGTVTLWFAETTEGVEGEISVSNDTTYEYFTLTADGEEDWTGDKLLTVEVAKGDVLTINVGALPDANWNWPAMNYSMAAVFEYPVGHKNNPAELGYFEVPGSVSLRVEPKETVYFESYSIGGLEMKVETSAAVVLHNNKTYKPSKGVIALTLAQSQNRQPVSFAIQNTSNSVQVYEVEFAYPLGWYENPQVIETPGTLSGKTAKADNDGYFYTYTALEKGTVTFKLSNVTKGVTGDINVTNMRTYNQLSLTYDGVNGKLSVPVEAGDELVFNVVAAPDKNWNIPAMSYKLTTAFVAPTMLEYFDIPGSVEVTVPAGETTYFQSYGIGETEMSVATSSAIVIYQDEEFSAEHGTSVVFPAVSPMERRPLYFAIKNTSNATATYTLEFVRPLGHRENPNVIEEGTYSVDLEAGNSGYYYKWIAEEEGTITVDLSATEGDWSYNVDNVTAGKYGDIHCSDEDPAVPAETVKVNAGDEISIMVTTYDPENPWNTPAGTINLDVTFEYPEGHELNPIDLTMTDASTTFALEVPAGETVYYQAYRVSGMNLTVATSEAIVYHNGETYEANEANGYSVTVALQGQGMWYPVVFAIENPTDSDVTYQATIAYPEGHQMNPEVIEDGTYEVTLAAGNNGYYYKWVAEETGTVTVDISWTEGGWQYVVNNITTGRYGDNHWSDEEEVVSSETVAVNPGDEIVIMVTTYDSENPWTAPEGTISIDVTFKHPEGHELNPKTLELSGVFPETLALEVPAGKTVYFQAYRVGGMNLTIASSDAVVLHNGESFETNANVYGDEVVTVSLVGQSMWDPVVFAIKNTTSADVTYKATLAYPVGTQSNPKAIECGEHTATISAATDGYFYTWTATEDGTVVFEMLTESDWTYTISNVTAAKYGEQHWSDDETVATTEELEVAEGDVITITVNTYDSETPWAAPEGTITFTLDYKEAN